MPVFAVTTAKGANWDHARGIREQPFWDQHAAFAEDLVDESTLRSIFGADPWAARQVFRIKQVWTWALWLDGRSRQARPAGDPPS